MTKLHLLLLASVAALALAACTTIPEQVKVPVPVACIAADDVPEKPRCAPRPT
jgi:starvation-inducible outer membrane lipoprotein